MSMEAAPQNKPPLCITNISTFFNLPNPRIFLLFIISSTATFSLGIAMILGWHLYSRHHPGYQWIVYYAPSLISLPIVLWIICVIFAILFSNKDNQNLRTEPPCDPSNSKQSRAEEKGELEHVEALQDQLALVTVEPLNDRPSGTAKESKHTSLAVAADDYSTLKRTLSLPLFHRFADNSSIKRRMSFG